MLHIIKLEWSTGETGMMVVSGAFDPPWVGSDRPKVRNLDELVEWLRFRGFILYPNDCLQFHDYYFAPD